MWLNEYSTLMFGSDNDMEKTIKAIELKRKYMPEVLYKYRSINQMNLNAFENNEIYLCSVSELNDLQECTLTIDYEQVRQHVYSHFTKPLKDKLGIDFILTPEDCQSREVLHKKILSSIELIPEKHLEYWMGVFSFFDKLFEFKIGEFSKEVASIGNEIYRVCSFSAINNEPLLWAHYADSNRGFCLGYNFRILNNDLTELMLPVRYSETMLDVSKLIFTKNDKNIILDAITRKSIAWEYEKEWRLVMLADHEDRKGQLLKVPYPQYLYLGTKVGDYNRGRLIEIAETKNMEVYEILPNPTRFGFTSKRIL